MRKRLVKPIPSWSFHKPRYYRYRTPKVVEGHSIYDILLLGSCMSLELCQLVDKSRYQSDLHPLLIVEGLAGFLYNILNLLQFLLSFLYGFGNIDSRHFTLGIGSSRCSRETSRIDSSGGSSDSWSTPVSSSYNNWLSKCGDRCWESGSSAGSISNDSANKGQWPINSRLLIYQKIINVSRVGRGIVEYNPDWIFIWHIWTIVLGWEWGVLTSYDSMGQDNIRFPKSYTTYPSKLATTEQRSQPSKTKYATFTKKVCLLFSE